MTPNKRPRKQQTLHPNSIYIPPQCFICPPTPSTHRFSRISASHSIAPSSSRPALTSARTTTTTPAALSLSVRGKLHRIPVRRSPPPSPPNRRRRRRGASSVFFYFSVFLFCLFACTPQAISPYIHTTPGPNSNNNNTPSHHHPRLDPPPTPTHQRGRRGRRRALCDAKDARARVRPPYASACSVDARYDARRSSVPPPPPPMDIFQPRYERRQLIDDTEPLVATIESSHTVNGHTVRYLSPTPQPPSRPSGVHHHRAFSPSHPSRPHASSSC